MKAAGLLENPAAGETQVVCLLNKFSKNILMWINYVLQGTIKMA